MKRSPSVLSQPSVARARNTGLLAYWMHFAETAQKTEGFWFIAGLLVASGSALAFTPQGQDLIRVVVEDGVGARSPPLWIPLDMLYVSVVFLGLQAWFWARAIVAFQFGAREEWNGNPFLLWIPRLFGLIPFGFLLLAIANSRSIEPIEAPVIVLSVSSAVFLVLMIFGDVWYRRVRESPQSRTARTTRAGFSALNYFVLALGLILAAASFAVVLTWPVGPATWVGAAAVVLFAISFIIPPMTVLIQFAGAWRIPVTLTFLVLALLFSVWNDNHALAIRSSSEWRDRPSAAAAWRQWRQQARPIHAAIPVIFIAAEGGASRAAFWTGHALATLEERSRGEFSRHTFLISAVSGSSLGSAAFLMTLTDNPMRDDRLHAAVDDFTGRDYLSPTLAGALFPDLAQRFVPWNLLPDRAAYLELGIEAGWTAHCAIAPGGCRDRTMPNRNFLDLWPRDRWLPALAIGGAREEDGRRILTSNIYFAGNQIDADDFHTLARGDVSVSTAILNGSRFPFLSPGGTLPPAAGGHVLDGGYFDAAGIETMREAAAAALASDTASVVPPQYANVPLQPIFILLENGGPSDSPRSVPLKAASMPGTDAMTEDADTGRFAPPRSRTDRVAPDFVGPFVGLLASRDAHAAHLRYLLEQAMRRAPICAQASRCPQRPPVLMPELIELQVCSRDLPLDWILSESVKARMSEQLYGADASRTCGNRAKIDHLVALLGH